MADKDSYIQTNAKGQVTTYVGPDAQRLFGAITLRAAIALEMKGIHITRGSSLTRCLTRASEITGKTYKRTQGEKARADLQTWIDTMKAAIPVVKS